MFLICGTCFAGEMRGPNLLGVEFEMPFGIYNNPENCSSLKR